MILVSPADFSVADQIAALRQRTAGDAGALVSFTGYVRDYAQGQGTQSLYLEHYPGMCENEILSICQEAAARWSVLDYTVVHRVGELPLSEQIVLVAVASAHRGEAFRACEYIIDALKTRAPFWKRETLSDGQKFWVQQRESDTEKTEQWRHGDKGESA
ncbi:molybdenum cofactor biosynthesis protein MoaE [Paracandidimonas soli]|uniref:Molybdopterin synthase catalytic subunit n=1 Tax=Paracandidimonas soli TaxID=1917182 RepID=A0A4R3VF07_9BURK|nr:molybdenum cofactor biosynthesis protein MoaE [Paracandidimonas soli]TCV01365.1 molybdopterin synthase subunit MoaE [Paracandidimonas soli]